MEEKKKVTLPENAFRELKPGEQYQPLLRPDKVYPEVTVWSVTIGLLMTVIFSAAAAFLGIRFLPNPRLKPHLRILGTVAASLSAALLIVSGFDLTDPTGQRSYFWGQHLLSVTVLLAVTALLWQWLHAMDKQR